MSVAPKLYTAAIEGDEFVIRINLKSVNYKKLLPSNTGKSKTIATSNGNVPYDEIAARIEAPERVMLGLNLYAVVPKHERPKDTPKNEVPKKEKAQ